MDAQPSPSSIGGGVGIAYNLSPKLLQTAFQAPWTIDAFEYGAVNSDLSIYFQSQTFYGIDQYAINIGGYWFRNEYQRLEEWVNSSKSFRTIDYVMSGGNPITVSTGKVTYGKVHDFNKGGSTARKCWLNYSITESPDGISVNELLQIDTRQQMPTYYSNENGLNSYNCLSLRSKWNFNQSLVVEYETINGNVPTIWDKKTTVLTKQIYYMDAQGNVVFTSNPVNAKGADGKTVEGFYHLSKDGATFILRKMISYGWLRSASYPVIIDPSTVANVMGTGTATRVPCQTKSYHAVDRHWTYFVNATVAYPDKLWSSADGTTGWTAATGITASSPLGVLLTTTSDGKMVTCTYKYPYAHFVGTSEAGATGYMRGTPSSDGSFARDIYPTRPIAAYEDEYKINGIDGGSTLWTLYDTTVSGNIRLLTEAGLGSTPDYTTMVHTKNNGIGKKFVYTPYTTVGSMTVNGSSGNNFPTIVQDKGWEFGWSSARKLWLLEGTQLIRFIVRNPNATAHSGYVYARVWKSTLTTFPNNASTTALTGWTQSGLISFSGVANEGIIGYVTLEMHSAAGADAFQCKGEYFYIEFGWEKNVATANVAVQLEAETATWLQLSEQRIGYPSLAVDATGHVWMSFWKRTGLLDVYPFLARNENTNATWDLKSSSVWKLSTTSGGAARWTTKVFPLPSGKLLTLYIRSTEQYSRYYDPATGLGAQVDMGLTATLPMVAATSFDAVPVYNPAYNISSLVVWLGTTVGLYQITAKGWDETTNLWQAVGAGSTVCAPCINVSSTSYPTLSFNNETTGAIPYCFWGNSTSIFCKSTLDYFTAWTYISGGAPLATEKALTAADILTTYNVAEDNIIGLMYMNKTSAPYQIRYLFLSFVAGVNYVRLLNETIANRDNIYKSTVLVRSESFRIADQLCKDVLKSLSDSFRVSDVPSQHGIFTIAEQIRISDAISLGIMLVPTEEIHITDGLSKEGVFVQTETIRIVDALSIHPTFVQTEDVGISDAVSKDAVLVQSETIRVLDAISQEATITNSESITFADRLHLEPTITNGEIIRTSEDISKDVTLVRGETVTVGDSRSKGFETVISETIHVADEVFSFLYKLIEQVITERIDIRDEVSKDVTLVVAEPIHIADVLTGIAFIVSRPFQFIWIIMGGFVAGCCMLVWRRRRGDEYDENDLGLPIQYW